jgi:site-specific recombinase XerD
MKQKKDKGRDMNAIAKRIVDTPAANPHEMALKIKKEAPTLADLNNEQLEMVAKLVMTQRLATELNTAVDIAGVDWQKEKEKFLKFKAAKSEHTVRGYRSAIARLDAWAAQCNINLLKLTPAEADDFINSLCSEKSRKTKEVNSPATVRVTVAAVSSFYTWLHRHHAPISNSFQGSKERPKEKAVRALAVPNKAELKIILKELPLMEAAAVSIMSGLGLRAGALPTLEKRGNRYKSISKGKEFYVDFTSDIIKRINSAGLPLRAPFADKTANSIELAVAYHIKKLFQAGIIAAAYSCHDFRHFAAVREYEKDHDIKRVRDFLNHSSISITERYLCSIGVKI